MALGSPLFIEQGLRPDHRDDAVHLFWDAFKGKLGPLLGPEARALDFLRTAIDPRHAISAVSGEGDLVGIAGFKTAQGGFVGGGIGPLRQAYGLPGGLWRGALLSVLDRPVEPACLLMDGIFVAAAARGQGVGTALIGSVRQKARELGCTSVRLDVIDSNPRARALYLRQGFVAEETSETGLFRHVFGFRSSTRMICML
ncbi:molybdopterin-guanine dinucleotide biosynthesis protein MobC [Hoeflea sp. BAL378]|nr:molybdopterin-guanine dinucleotide biosynthesis protein MobC [Hoeflea sp. BAL378]